MKGLQNAMEKSSAFELNFNDLVRIAAEKGASDLHIEPFQDFIRVRARVDGVLQLLQIVSDPKYFERFLLQAKRACRFEMAKHMVPQVANVNYNSLRRQLEFPSRF